MKEDIMKSLEIGKNKMEINNKDLRLAILGCFRYALGRMTYMPSHTFDIIKNCQEVFNEQDWERFIKEIDGCNNLGMDCDKRVWNDLKEFCKCKLEETT